MAGTSDKVFLRAFKWFRDAVTRLQTELPSDPPVNLSATLTDILRTKLGLQLDKTEATIDPERLCCDSRRSAFASRRDHDYRRDTDSAAHARRGAGSPR